MATAPLLFGQYYHIYNRGNNREKLFVESRNYPYFLKLYSQYILPVAETFAYCLMPNHFHLLIRTRTEEEQEAHWQQIGSLSQNEPISFKLRQPSRAFNNLFIAYARAFNNATGRTGVLFETPFHRKHVSNDAYFQILVVYIHRNPEKHGFVDDFRNWKWSSYSAILSDKATQLQRDAVLAWFGGRSGFVEAHYESGEEMLFADWFNLED